MPHLHGRLWPWDQVAFVRHFKKGCSRWMEITRSFCLCPNKKQTKKTIQRIKTTNSSKTRRRLTSEKQHILFLLSKWETSERRCSLVNFTSPPSSARPNGCEGNSRRSPGAGQQTKLNSAPPLPLVAPRPAVFPRLTRCCCQRRLM